jgi:hypothetical protein
MNAITALEMFRQIPTDQIIPDSFTDEKGKCCAIGHLVRLTSQNPKDYSLNNCWLSYVPNPVRTFCRETVSDFTGGHDLSDINNAITGRYQQATPKERVIAVLEDMVKASPDETVIKYSVSTWSKIKNFLDTI